jgi:NAD(P)-dependent dehydrogenase (short-subunit alcohol dehydrogenase family)
LLGRPSDRLDAALRECRELGPGQDHRTVGCDLGDAAAIQSAAERVIDVATPIALVNNVGIVERARLEALTEGSLRRQLDVNLVGPIWLTRALLPSMRAAGQGRIVNVSSISARLGTAGQVAYNASKWGLL